MGYVCKLTRGALTLDLNDNEYSLAYGFTPPAIVETASIAYGGSANRYGGGRKIDERILPRDYTFTVKISGTSNAQCEAAIDRLDTFLRQGTDDDPVYFCFKPDNNVSHEPLWGQFGATRRCKVLAGHCEKSGEIYGDVRDKIIYADVSLTINGVEGLRQRVGEATGGILENTMFSPDGISRGLIIPEGTTNKFDNPIFGNADPDLDYTTGAGALSATNTDKNFVYPGATNSIKLSCVTAATAYFYQVISLTAVAHTHSAWVKKADGTAASATDVKIYYDAAQTSTYTYLGNGITRVSFSNTPTAAAHNVGVILMTVGVTVYVMGFQSEAKAYATPLCWGNLMGCYWGAGAGTPHADNSTSTRTEAWCRFYTDDILSIAEGTIRLIWMPDKANTALIADAWLFEESTDKFNARFDNDDEKFYFGDGINTISSAATTFAANTPIILHYVFEAGSLKIYRAGVEIATGSTYTPSILPSSVIYLGTDDDINLHCNGTFLGFATYEYAMSATEVANDYTNALAHVNGGDGYGQQLELIPWCFSNDTSIIVDSYCDATHWDWIVCGGIPGSLPAETIFITQNSTDNRSLTISNYQSLIFHSPSDYFNATDATAVALNTTATLGKAINVAASIHKDLCRYPAYLWASLHDHGANLTIAPRVELSTSAVGYTGDYRPITTSATNKDFITYSIENIENPEIETRWSRILARPTSDAIDYELWLQRSADGAADVTIDYMRVMFGSLTYIYNDVAADSTLISINGNKVYIADNAATPIVAKFTAIQGDLFELYPNTLNHIILQTGDLGADTVTAATTNIQSIYVTPRWALA